MTEGVSFRRHLRLLVVFFSLLGLLSLLGNRGLVRLYRLSRTKGELSREIERLQTSNEALRRQLEALKTDPFAIEKIAREDLGLVRPGEIVYDFRTARGPQSDPPRP